jgi:RND family efflux transporter MFP subunit
MPRPLIALLLAGLAAAACSRPPKAESKPPKLATLVRVAPLELRQLRREIETTAFLESEHRVSVIPKVTGRIHEVLVDEGALVKRGQVLARFDAREVRSAIRQHEVQLLDREVRAKLARLENEAAVRRVEQARIERDQAEANWKRNAGMDPEYVAAKILEDTKAEFESAVRRFQIAEFNERKAKLDVDAADNAIEEARARLDDAKLRLEEHDLLSPIDGVVVSREVKGGETIAAATALFVVVDPHDLVAYLNRPQRELGLLGSAREVRFRSDAAPDREYTAHIDLLGPVVDPATGSFKLRMRVAPEDVAALRPGMFVRARILTESLRDALMVPKAAVLAEGERSLVFAVRGGRACKVWLDPGLEERLFVEARNRGDDGLNPEDVVVVSGNADLKDQVEVEVAKEG